MQKRKENRSEDEKHFAAYFVCDANVSYFWRREDMASNGKIIILFRLID